MTPSATPPTASRPSLAAPAEAADEVPRTPIVLVSHALCPYVQRVAIVLAEKGLAFDRHDIDLANKPDWFLRLSPLGKTPVLQVDGQALFESAVICEYLDDVAPPRLHPADALQRARHRAWMAVGSAVLDQIAAFYNARDDAALHARAADIRGQLVQLEATLGDGPFFAGTAFGIVDAVFGPVFRYLDAFDAIGGFAWCDGLPKLQRWRAALARRPSVAQAVRPDYADRLQRFLRARGGALSHRMAQAGAAG